MSVIDWVKAHPLPAAGGVGAVGVVGLVLYEKHKAASASGSSTSSTAAGAPAYATPGNPADLNSIGSDVATQFGQLQGGVQTSLDQFASQLQGAVTALQAIPPQNAPVTTPAPVSSTPAPGPAPASTSTSVPVSSAPAKSFVTVTPYPSTLGTLSGIAGYEHESLATVESLNPQIKNPNLIYPGEQVRVK